MNPALLHALLDAEALVIAAGAGMGVDSGLPDFRGTEGFWRAYPAVARLGLRFEQMANPTWFHRDPHLAWAFYGHRLNLYRTTLPHDGFTLLRHWSERLPHGAFVFTSNVDGQFQRAGFDPARLVECHGSLHHVQCSRPCTDVILPADHLTLTVDEATFRAADPLPRCPACGAVARPNVLMFGDDSWIPDRTDAQWAALELWLEILRAEHARLLVIELGAGSAVPTVRHFSEDLARSPGTSLLRINPREPEVPRGHFSLAEGALAGLRQLDAILAPHLSLPSRPPSA